MNKEIPFQKQDRFQEITQHLCSDARPSVYLTEQLHNGGFAEAPFSMLLELEHTEQSPIHHPEGHVWNHTCLVVDEAARVRAQSAYPMAFMWAALLHDIGKPSTTRVRRGRITSYDHDKVGMRLAIEFMEALTDDRALITQVGKLVRYHMHPLFVLKNLPFANMDAMKRDIDLQEIALLSYCDRMGRTNADSKTEYHRSLEFLEKCGA